MPPAYVKPYVKRQKNDAADAEAICEAVTRPNMRFVPTKTPEQQSCLMLHRTRHLFIRQQTALINSIRAHLAEFGIVAPVGRNGVEQLFLGLDRAGAEAELEWGQRQARQHQQTRRSLSAQLVHSRCARRDPLCEAPRYQASAVAYGVVGAAAHQSCRHRACQQDGPNGLGNDDQGRALQGTRRTRGVKEIASSIRRDVTVGKGEQHVMQSRSIRRSGQPTRATAWSNAWN